MTKMITVFLFIIIACLNDVSAQPDTIPPTYTWVSPKELSVYRTNTIRLCVDAQDNPGGSGIQKVVFYVQYVELSYTGFYKPKEYITTITTFPYEYLWDCSSIQDFGLGYLRILCDVFDNAGNVSSKAIGSRVQASPEFVLDRNLRLKNEIIRSHKIDKKIIIDGDLGEWTPQDSLEFYNNDNRITVYSLWNDENVYFGIKVKDNSLISHYTPEQDDPTGLPYEDVIEIYFDTNHDRTEFLDDKDKHYLFAAGGMTYESTIFSVQPTRKFNINKLNSKVKIQGSLNNDQDIDSGYIIELALRWEEIGVLSSQHKQMGLEIWNNDKDFIKGKAFYLGWTTSINNWNNPSEWGTIVFIEKKGVFPLLAVTFAALILSTLLIFIIWKRKKKDVTIETHVSESVENPIIIKAKRYIEEHFDDETLSREEIAHYIGLTPSYFSALYKKETGHCFSEYVKNVRLEKAKVLLVSTSKNIAEIAYEVGFSSQSYFTQLFSHEFKISPNKLRKKTWKK